MNKEEVIFISSVSNYRFIANEHYHKFLQFYNEAKEIATRNNYQYNNDEDYDSFKSMFYQSVHNAIISIVFEAFAIEAFINEYIAKKLSYKCRKEVDERNNNIRSKILDAINKATNKNFPEESKAYDLINKLFSMRNKLVHSKTRKIIISKYDLNTEEDSVK